jgi:hypothetical protein
MSKDWFNEQIEKIEVPRDEVFSAIHKGMSLGRKEKKKRKWLSGIRNASFITSAAASILLVSGFIFSPVSHVLASVPIIGTLYDNFHSEIGKELAANQLVTELNEKATSNGIDVTLTSAFYDGNVIGFTFKANGEDISVNPKDIGPEAGYSYHLFDVIDNKQWGGTGEGLIKKGDSYIAAFSLEYPEKELPKDLTIPLTFTHIGGKYGEWKFNVPVQQIPVKKIESNTITSSKDGAYTFKMESVIRGEATTIINYQTIVSELVSKDLFDIKVVDDQGNELSRSGVNSQRAKFDDKIENSAKYLMIYPEFSNPQGKLVNIDPIKINLEGN